MACQLERRASSGCVLDDWPRVVLVGGEREARRVSCRPGAEGAPADVDVVFVCAVVLLVLEAWLGRGTMRRD